MSIGNFAITSFIIGVLSLRVFLSVICITIVTLYLIVRQEEQVVSGCRHIARYMAGVIAHVVRVLSHRLHAAPQIRGKGRHQTVSHRAGRGFAVTQQRLPHIAVLPAAHIGVAAVHVEITVPRNTGAVVVVTQSHHLPADLADLEVDAVGTFLAAVVIESQDERLHRQIGDTEAAHRTVDSDGLSVSHRPIVGPLTSIRSLLDGAPAVVVERRGGQRHGHAAGLIRRGGMVGAGRHLDGNRGASLSLGRHGDGCATHAHGGHTGVAGGSGDCAVPTLGHGNRAGHSTGIQRHAGLIQGQTTRSLRDTPGHGLGRCSAIRPAVIGFRGEGGAVGASIGAGGGAALRHLRTVIAVECGALGAPVVGKSSAGRGDRHTGPADRPVDGNRLSAAVAPIEALLGGKCGCIGTHFRPEGLPTNSQLLAIKAVPCRALLGAGIGQAPILRGNSVDGVGQLGDRLQRRVRRCLCVLSCRCGLLRFGLSLLGSGFGGGRRFLSGSKGVCRSIGCFQRLVRRTLSGTGSLLRRIGCGKGGFRSALGAISGVLRCRRHFLGGVGHRSDVVQLMPRNAGHVHCTECHRVIPPSVLLSVRHWPRHPQRPA